MNSGDTVHLYRFRVHTIGSIPHLVLTGRRPGRNYILLQHSLHLSLLGYVYRRASLSLNPRRNLQAPIAFYFLDRIQLRLESPRLLPAVTDLHI